MNYALLIGGIACLLAGCGDSEGKTSGGHAAAQAWQIGPTIDGRNYSTGSVSGNTITVADVHYITRPTGPLAREISIAFALSAPLTGTGCTGPATATLYFQRSGDDWNTDGARWWATFATVTVDHAGDYSMTAPLDGPWTSVEKKTAIANPSDFADAKAHAARVGMTLGNCTGYGHGATGPAQLTITSFEAS
jgi:hypothetical protein